MVNATATTSSSILDDTDVQRVAKTFYENGCNDTIEKAIEWVRYEILGYLVSSEVEKPVLHTLDSSWEDEFRKSMKK